jgi:hypothetical protein
MLRIVCGLILSVAGMLFYWLGQTPHLLGSDVAPAGIHRANGLMWGTALVLFLWVLMDRIGRKSQRASSSNA